MQTLGTLRIDYNTAILPETSPLYFSILQLRRPSFRVRALRRLTLSRHQRLTIHNKAARRNPLTIAALTTRVTTLLPPPSPSYQTQTSNPKNYSLRTPHLTPTSRRLISTQILLMTCVARSLVTMSLTPLHSILRTFSHRILKAIHQTASLTLPHSDLSR